jgi:hypothetical protein
MKKERRLYEQRISEYKEKALAALQTVNNTTELFNSYGAPFSVWDKEDFKRNCKDGYVSGVLTEKLQRDQRNGVSGENLRRHKYRYSLIEKKLTEQISPASKAIKEFGRLMVYDPEGYLFKLNLEKLEISAFRYADDLE